MLYFLTFLVAFSISVTVTPVVRWLMIKMEVLDLPGDRKIHLKPIPRMGGIAIVTAFFLAVFFAWKFEPYNHQVHMYYLPLLGIGFGAMLIVLVGIFDDTIGADVWHKLFVQCVAGFVVSVCGLSVAGAFIPFIGHITFDPVTSSFLTTLWIVAVINIVNLIDGLDGLASGVAAISAFVFLTVSFMKGLVFPAVISCALIGSIIGFWRYNFHPAEIFMGDVGSMFLGFLLGTLALLNGMTYLKASTVTFSFLALGLPIFDTSYAILRRMKKGRHIFGADKEHIHHQFISSGLSHKNAVLAIYTICSILGALAIIIASFYNTTLGRI